MWMSVDSSRNQHTQADTWTFFNGPLAFEPLDVKNSHYLTPSYPHSHQDPKASHAKIWLSPPTEHPLPIGLHHTKGRMSMYNGMLIVASNVKTNPSWILFESFGIPRILERDGILLPIGTVRNDCTY